MRLTGTRQLKDITDSELEMFVELTGCYGVKGYWGEIKVTRVDREIFASSIVVKYEQDRIDDGLKSKRTLFFNHADMNYFSSMSEPWDRIGDSCSIMENTELVLWLIKQDFDILGTIDVKNVNLRMNMSSLTHGYIVSNHMPSRRGTDGWKFFGVDSMEDALKYIEETDKSLVLYKIVESRKIDDSEFRPTEEHIKMLASVTGFKPESVKNGVFEVSGNMMRCEAPMRIMDDLVGAGYADRSGWDDETEYSATQKGMSLLAKHYGVRIRYTMEFK